MDLIFLKSVISMPTVEPKAWERAAMLATKFNLSDDIFESLMQELKAVERATASRSGHILHRSRPSRPPPPSPSPPPPSVPALEPPASASTASPPASAAARPTRLFDLDAQAEVCETKMALLHAELYPNDILTSVSDVDILGYRCSGQRVGCGTGPGGRCEFGIQLASDVPALYVQRGRVACCPSDLEASGLRHLYYFLPLLSRHKNVVRCGGPSANRTNLETQVAYAYHDFKIEKRPKQWMPPPYASFFATPIMKRAQSQLAKPLLIIANKFDVRKEFLHSGRKPFTNNTDYPGNFIDVGALSELVHMLLPRYTIYYFRYVRYALCSHTPLPPLIGLFPLDSASIRTTAGAERCQP